MCFFNYLEATIFYYFLAAGLLATGFLAAEVLATGFLLVTRTGLLVSRFDYLVAAFTGATFFKIFFLVALICLFVELALGLLIFLFNFTIQI